jgi:hypothetical protein
MSLLNLLLFPILMALGLFESNGSGGDGAGDQPAASGKDAPPADGAKPDAAPDAKPDAKAEPLGEGGKAALEEERRARREEKRRADAAEAELNRIKEANQSESERAINAARKEGKEEADTRWSGIVRRTSVESALVAAGCSDPAIVSRAAEFANLNVNSETGEVEDLAATVQTFKNAHPTLFTARVPSGSVDQGARPTEQKPSTLADAVNQHYAGSPS